MNFIDSRGDKIGDKRGENHRHPGDRFQENKEWIGRNRPITTRRCRFKRRTHSPDPFSLKININHFFFCLPLRNMAPLASALSDTVILEPRPSRLGGTCWEAGLGNPEAPSAECLVLRRCFCQLYLVCRCAGGSAESLCLQGPPRSCHDLNRGLVPCGGAAIGWSHAHGRCPHHQLGPEAGAI